MSSPAAMKAVPPLARMRLTRFGRRVPVLGSCVVRGGIDIAGSELHQAAGLEFGCPCDMRRAGTEAIRGRAGGLAAVPRRARNSKRNHVN